ncbi:bacterial extracellular solute-binding protein [Streptococcus pneumoniae]|nr:bacterial extracellular solute-binding protein [Streptococcus pneumoniae]
MNKKSLLKCAVIGLVATFGLAACGTSKDASGEVLLVKKY